MKIANYNGAMKYNKTQHGTVQYSTVVKRSEESKDITPHTSAITCSLKRIPIAYRGMGGWGAHIR